MPIDVSKLDVSLEEGERWRRTLKITVPSALLANERRAALKQLSSNLKLPGFRAGKVPASVVERRFGQALEQEMLDKVIDQAYRGALEERSLRPISEGEVGKIAYEPEADLQFQVSFDVAPEVELPRLGGFRVERPPVDVSEDDVAKVLERVREQEGTWVPIEEGAPVEGEKVSVRIERLDAEGDAPHAYEFTLGAGEAIPDIESAIESLGVGGTGDFTIVFPETVANEERRGTEERVRITLESRKTLELPELDDALAKSVGEFESVDALRDKIREDLTAEAERDATGRIRGALLEQIVAANPFEIPESMVDQYVRSVLGDPKDLPEERFQEAKEQVRPQAVPAVKRYLVIEKVAEAHGLVATSEDVDARIEEIAERGGVSPSEVYGRLQKSGQIERIEREITERKVFEFLEGQSEITEPS